MDLVCLYLGSLGHMLDHMILPACMFVQFPFQMRVIPGTIKKNRSALNSVKKDE